MQYDLDPMLAADIIRLAKAYDISKVILFGSRARGDNHARSDIDLAVLGGNVAAFRYAVDATTLLKFDVIDLARDLSHNFRQSIAKEGVLIYAKT